MPKWFRYILLSQAISLSTTAQSVSADSSFSRATANAASLYYHALKNQSPVYNGSEYLEYPAGFLKGHPFFETTEFEKGTIHFDGMVFENVPMLYDITRDQVVILHFGNFYKINLPFEKIEQFTLLDHTFIRLLPDSNSRLKPAFYDLLYSGKISFLSKREKKLSELHDDKYITNLVTEEDIYYIKKDGVYHTVKNIRNLLDVLTGKRAEIRQYFKKNNIKFRADREHAIQMAVEYYDRLTN